MLSIAAWMGGTERLIHRLPGFDGWTKGRDMPAPPGRTFRELYRAVYTAVAAGEPPTEPDYPTFAAGHEQAQAVADRLAEVSLTFSARAELVCVASARGWSRAQ